MGIINHCIAQGIAKFSGKLEVTNISLISFYLRCGRHIWTALKAFADCLVNFHAGTIKELPWTLLKEHFSGIAKVFADVIVSFQVSLALRLHRIWYI